MIGELLVAGGWRAVIKIHSIGICLAVIERVLRLYMEAWSWGEWGLIPICIFGIGKRGPGNASLARCETFSLNGLLPRTSSHTRKMNN